MKPLLIRATKRGISPDDLKAVEKGFSAAARKIRNVGDKLVIEVEYIEVDGIDFLFVRKLDPETISVYRA